MCNSLSDIHINNASFPKRYQNFSQYNTLMSYFNSFSTKLKLLQLFGEQKLAHIIKMYKFKKFF